MLFAAIHILLRGLGASMIDDSDCVNNSDLSSFHPIVFVVRIHSMLERFIGIGGEFGCYHWFPGRVFQCSITDFLDQWVDIAE